MASSTLSGFGGVSLPFLSQRNIGVKPSTARRGLSNKIIRAMAGEGRDSLDHLQRSARLQQQAQPKKKAPQQAPIGVWDRFPNARTVQQMMETMESLLEDPVAYSNAWSSSPVQRRDVGGYRRGGRTPWEIKELEKEYKMRFDVPGMSKSDVKLFVEEKMLVVKAEKVGKKEEEEEEDEWSAESYGKYSSRIALPENVEFEKIRAEVRDGVLYITIPKLSVQTKILDINVE